MSDGSARSGADDIVTLHQPETEGEAAPSKGGSGLAMRIGSSVVLIPPVLAAVYFGSPYFEILAVICLALLGIEWARLVQGKIIWVLMGIPYIALPIAAMVWIRGADGWGLAAFLWLLGVVWATDTGAYAAGRSIGGPKLAPRISPKKTWAGLLGGMACAMAVGAGAAHWLGQTPVGPLMVVSGVLAVVAQIGDLFESWVKRHFNVKDSGSMIPGHGGLLDRMDGLLAAGLALALLFALTEGGGGAWL
ncbi:phosphatidate cytidylyltransferase [Magnetospira sp. QH-2]|uniref:phosphatidate cytidylyltransferase n=1 Tax=Magnetospira sp. (strain QH-2) TaxID=1288970 RepID=UPI0003E81A5E|nr:phosphatidate cytidylyltransferase [Magnetospira sp. QH-2]CCQ73983.1 Phosphatidate cytidylyltransferase [Magnetospira sp. QH-2]